VDQSNVAVVAVAFLSLLAISVIVVSILILGGGKFYKKIPEKSRPRRWLVAIFFSYFILFGVWFPVQLFYPHSTVSHFLSFMFLVFTVFIAAWVALGRVGDILLPIIHIIQRIVGRSD
jgi:hypothetical protein